MNPQIAAGIEAIRQDRSHGASELAREALKVLASAALVCAPQTRAELLQELKSVAIEIAWARPAMAPLCNWVSRFFYELRQGAETAPDVKSLRSQAVELIQSLINELDMVLFSAAVKAADLVEEGDRILTCSYSSTVCRALEIAKGQGKVFRVWAAESRSGVQSYGEPTALRLGRQGIEVEVIPDNSIGDYARTSTRAIVGADSILKDGSLVNGTPSRILALAARDSHIPYWVVCETAKLRIKGYSDAEAEPGFDLVPAELITGIVTEMGVLPPAQVGSLFRRFEEYAAALSH